MHELLDKKYPYLASFFDSMFVGDKVSVPNSIIFYGSDVLAQYYFALILAKKLNCSSNGDDCECRNCSWIKQNKHPAVMTISKIDSKTDSSKTVISKEQVDSMRDLLVNSSDYHRVFIFCDADFVPKVDKISKHMDEFSELAIALPQCEDESMTWYPKGLTKACFQDVAANSILKCIEEPPSKVTFVFLCEDKNDLIQTIISRSQSFFIPSFLRETYETSYIQELFESYPNIEIDEGLKISRKLLEYQEKNDYTPQYVLDSIQYYLKELILQNLSNKSFVSKAKTDILKLQESKKMISAYIKDKTVYEDFALYLTH